MHIYAKLVLSLFIVGSVGCSTNSKQAFDAYTLSECDVGDSCSLTGEIFIARGVPASVANLKLDSAECVALSLPEEAYKNKKLQFSKVRVFGVVYSQPSLFETDIVSYKLLDRMVAVGICETGKVIYVEKIKRF